MNKDQQGEALDICSEVGRSDRESRDSARGKGIISIWDQDNNNARGIGL